MCLPLGGKNAEETINVKKLKKYSFLIRKILSTEGGYEIFTENYFLAKDESFEYAEKIENLIKQTNK